MPPADPRPARRVKDPALLKALHREWTECALRHLPDGCAHRLSLHHIHKHRDDMRPNLVMLCGSGTTGHHGLVEAHDPPTLRALYRYLSAYRPDTLRYLAEHLGSPERAGEWLTRTLLTRKVA